MFSKQATDKLAAIFDVVFAMKEPVHRADSLGAKPIVSAFDPKQLDSASKTLDFRIETSTFPNWDGIDQKRAFTLHDDELRYTVAAGSAGTSSALVWKRIP